MAAGAVLATLALLAAVVHAVPTSPATRGDVAPLPLSPPPPDAARLDPPADAPNPAARFVTYDLFVDPGVKPLAAYQVDVRCTTNDALLTGLEGGDAAPFRDAPYYDPKALVNERIVVAAYSTAADVPAGKARVARLHLRVAGKDDPKFEVKVTAAAGPDGAAIDATAAVARTGQ
ncbi:MAG TPA: hypothetical protein VF796_07930 [Humisphaera sp.]